ncbi:MULTISPECIES: LysR family transcriptional regulator [Rahnella]|uniref:LysR family transcriptional regulator n=1 Tax=Rahnella laticis TaxID=2787622 RepID=A0ABS0E478_9GAMM|nr:MULTISPECIES: LysR family transcriptional regulator [Rahnella]MBF7978810.1 LysR family transcriptional regulator [Rahnella laticis]MBF7998900.1 LysR family transcriptional regulator [Rahnella sp. LAC-M12]
MQNNNIIENIKKISAFDFNLLFIFETIFIYSSVSIAAEQLDSSPSSVSQSLKRLRTYFSDPLFVRKGQSLVPTTVAISLHEKISKELNGLVNSLVNTSKSETTHKFIVYSAPYTAQRILPSICSEIYRKNLPYQITHISADASLDAAEDILTYRKADVVFDTTPDYGNSTTTTLYMQESIVAVCSKSHPRLGTTLSKEEMQNETFVRLNINTVGIQRPLKEYSKYLSDRKFIFPSGCIDVNAAVLEATDSVAFVSEWFFDNFGQNYNLKKLDIDFDFKPVEFYMTYNKSSLNNIHFAGFIDVVKRNIKMNLVPSGSVS